MSAPTDRNSLDYLIMLLGMLGSAHDGERVRRLA
jgi:hypothetical protein